MTRSLAARTDATLERAAALAALVDADAVRALWSELVQTEEWSALQCGSTVICIPATCCGRMGALSR